MDEQVLFAHIFDFQHKVNTGNGIVHVEPHKAFYMQLGVVMGTHKSKT